MKRLLTFALIFLSLLQTVSAETASDGNITISIDIPEYVSQNETFLINLSAVDISVYPVARAYVYMDAALLGRSWVYFYESTVWNNTIHAIFRGGVGGIEWYLPSDANYNAGQTIPVKFRAERVTHTVTYRAVYWPIGYGHNMSVMTVNDTVTAEPIFDSSVHMTVYNAGNPVFEAKSGRGVNHIRFSEDNQQYIVNWDTKGNPPGEYRLEVNFDNGYTRETTIQLH